MKIGKSAGKSWEYLFGVYLGDGCITKDRIGHPVFRLNTIDMDFAQATKDALQMVTGKPVHISTHSVKKSSKPNHSLSCRCRIVSERMVSETDGKKKLPDFIWNSDRDGKLAFIAGLMDSEGFVCKSGSGSIYIGFKSTDVWFYDFIRLLNSAGIEIGKVGVEKPLKEHYRTPRRFHVRIFSWLRSGAYFNIARKQERIDMWASQLTPEANMQNAA